MMPQLKAEFKKLLTVRTTYVITVLAIALTCLFTYLSTSAVYVQNAPAESQTSTEKPASNEPEKSTSTPQKETLSKDLTSDYVQSSIGSKIPIVSILVTIVVILLMAHEFRYNTINYTLTSSNSRSRVLAAKLFVGSAYTILVTLAAIAAGVGVTYLAVNIKGLTLAPQDINWLYVIGRLLIYTLGFSLFGLAIITLVRNLTAGIVAVFILPTIDGIAGGLLASHNIEAAKFLPFSSLTFIGNVGGSEAPAPGMTLPTMAQAIAVAALYIVVLWAVAWYLFLKRDAT